MPFPCSRSISYNHSHTASWYASDGVWISGINPDAATASTLLRKSSERRKETLFRSLRRSGLVRCVWRVRPIVWLLGVTVVAEGPLSIEGTATAFANTDPVYSWALVLHGSTLVRQRGTSATAWLREAEPLLPKEASRGMPSPALCTTARGKPLESDTADSVGRARCRGRGWPRSLPSAMPWW